ncbi:hypothetical protein FOQG_01517 [Fusarium oxysporum f. sp. raphani 54005]|nr:hypothetical protein FOXG_03300 [Fusarium oxysporum f. sp. lycopersici 4287]XP_031071613.1 uncharacterized protein FOIG_02314 [Fusarium odoratissimum NRRL 54006]EWY88706.1 hypothetical protein FOYG_09788 [Fusarium oxysporum NRRL 32931]EWZ39780.1 hypothetical protein FOZG_08757 [Fusarium oxysporum Fo47]EWZ88122.1 hypothetical protein FOWG_09702 [Fusarium oxysporum f. sp. lycopersici MN25]EXA40582.1 hypothetical protein FOVG_09363 [Fusarium oxysporum f. sp. pisi HDV247]EXK30838.1 hypothetica
MAFLVVWLLGDITNLIGALFTHLAPTAIALAGYFCIADIVLIGQAVYYNALNARRASRAGERRSSDPTEESPLINGSRRRSSSFGLPGSQRRHATHTESSMDPLRKIVTGEDETPDSKPWLHNTLSLLAVYVIGFAGWFVSYKVGAWESGDPGTPDAPEEAQSPMELAGLILGYISAALYLCARIPQIIKNHREKSCEGMLIHACSQWTRLIICRSRIAFLYALNERKPHLWYQPGSLLPRQEVLAERASLVAWLSGHHC